MALKVQDLEIGLMNGVSCNWVKNTIPDLQRFLNKMHWLQGPWEIICLNGNKITVTVADLKEAQVNRPSPFPQKIII
jgi:hypothetical protein